MKEKEIRETLDKTTAKSEKPNKKHKVLNPDKRKKQKLKTVKESEVNG